jgi:putative membrane protein
VVVVAGLSLWLTGIGKPADFYTHNPLFLTKVGLAIVAGLLSLVPTVFFLKERKDPAEELVNTPKRIVFFIRLQLFILIFLPLLATLMAKGIGYQAPN